MHRRAPDGDHEQPELRQSEAGPRSTSSCARRCAEWGKRARRSARRSRAATSRSTTRIPRGAVYPDAGHRHGRARSTRSTHVTRATFQQRRRHDRLLGEPTGRAGRQRVSRANPRRGRGRAAALRSRAEQAADRRAARGDPRRRRLDRRTTAATAASPWRSPSACMADRDRQLERDGRSLGVERTCRARALLFGEAQARVIVSTDSIRTTVLAIAAAARRSRARHRRRACGDDVRSASRVAERRARSAPVEQLAERYHERDPVASCRASRVADDAGRRARLDSEAADIMCGIFGVHGPSRRGVARAARVCIRCSIADRSRPASSPIDEDGTARAACEAWGSCPTCSTRASSRRSHGDAGDRSHALQHRRLVDDRERAAGARALARRPHRARAQRQPHQRRRAARRARGPGLDLRVDDGLRGDRPPARAIERARRPEERLADALRGVEGAYSLIVAIGDTLLAARDPRGWRPLVHRHARTTPTSFALARPARSTSSARPYDARRRAGRDRRRRRERRCARSSRSSRRNSKRCVFEYVYFARPDSRIFGGSVDRARRALGRRLARECPAPGADLVFSVPDSSNSAALGFAEESGLPYELALIRNHYVGPHVHPADAGGARREGEGEVQRRARGARGQERRDGGRLDRARHDHARPRRHGARRRRARSAHARQLAAGHRARATTASTRRSREELIAANMTIEEIAAAHWRRFARLSSRSTECWSPCRAGRTASATPASPATIQRRRQPIRTSSASAAAADR